MKGAVDGGEGGGGGGDCCAASDARPLGPIRFAAAHYLPGFADSLPMNNLCEYSSLAIAT